MKNYYEILEIDKNASSDEIKTAYKKKAIVTHPDKNPDQNAKEQFIEIVTAYDTLSDQKKRKEYDQKINYSTTIDIISETSLEDIYIQLPKIIEFYSDKFKLSKIEIGDLYNEYCYLKFLNELISLKTVMEILSRQHNEKGSLENEKKIKISTKTYDNKELDKLRNLIKSFEKKLNLFTKTKASLLINEIKTIIHNAISDELILEGKKLTIIHRDEYSKYIKNLSLDSIITVRLDVMTLEICLISVNSELKKTIKKAVLKSNLGKYLTYDPECRVSRSLLEFLVDIEFFKEEPKQGLIMSKNHTESPVIELTNPITINNREEKNLEFYHSETILLDVDDTLIIKNGSERKINYPLINELKKAHNVNVILFTNMDLSELESLDKHSNADGIYSSARVTRHDLIRILKNSGINIFAVMTPADVAYNKGIGAAYKDFYVPAFTKKIKNESYEAEKNQYNSYRDQLVVPKGYEGKLRAAGQKYAMFSYLLQETKNGISTYLYVDDDKNCLDAIQRCAENYESKEKPTPYVITLQINPMKYQSKSEMNFYSEIIDSFYSLVQNKMTKKIIIFDRDYTLIDKDMKLINKDEIISLIDALDQSSSNRWGIASYASFSLEEDPAYIEINSKLAISKKPFYPQFSSMTIANNAIKVENPSTKEISESIRTAQNMLAELFQKGLDGKLTPYEVQLDQNTVWTIKLPNQTVFKVRADELNQSRMLWVEGSYRLTSILIILDKLWLKLSASKELNSLGIIDVTAPKNFQEISSNDIIYIDDKKSNCTLLKKAGFNSIEADTNCSPDHQNSLEHNTYLDQIYHQLPDELQNAWLQKYAEASIFHIISAARKDDFQDYCNQLNKLGHCSLTHRTIGSSLKVPLNEKYEIDQNVWLYLEASFSVLCSLQNQTTPKINALYSGIKVFYRAYMEANTIYKKFIGIDKEKLKGYERLKNYFYKELAPSLMPSEKSNITFTGFMPKEALNHFIIASTVLKNTSNSKEEKKSSYRLS